MEIGVPERCANQHAARRQGANHLMEIKWYLLQAARILGQPRHVARLTPAPAELPDRRSTIIVIEIRIEATAAHDDLEAFIEDRGEDGVMTLGWRLVERNGQRAIRVQGGGMDMRFHLVSTLSAVLFHGQERAEYVLDYELA